MRNRAVPILALVGTLTLSACHKPGATENVGAETKVDPMVMEGWKSFRWGMSPAEAEKAAPSSGFSIVRRETKEGVGILLFLSPYTMSGVSVEPVLLFEPVQAPQLVRVGLPCPDGKDTLTIYEILKRDLTETLGIPPTSKHRTDPELRGYHSNNDVWSYPKTTVRIIFWGYEDKPDGNLLVVSYQDPKSIREQTER